jgi:cation diffusion facilitator CzcD-associated flavoprotein CzcO
MLQRSPSYVLTLPGQDAIADVLRKRLPQKLAYSIVRWKNVLVTTAFFQLSRRRPKFVKKMIRTGVKRQLPESIDVDKHFSPRYDPWDQRMCLVPDGDMFRALRKGDASVVTDQIETFTETGIKLASGEELEADVVVTATGLNMLLLGGVTVSVDGEEVNAPDHVAYKGMMLSGVPNMAMALGYTNASWTLKCDLVSEYVCRLINHMDARGYDVALPIEPGPSEPREPIIDLKSGYVLRSLDLMPKQGARVPWKLHQNYARDIRMLRRGEIEDEGIAFSRVGARETAAAA